MIYFFLTLGPDGGAYDAEGRGSWMNLASSTDVRSVMPHQPSDVALSTVNPARAPPGFGEIKHAASHPDVQDDPHITTDVGSLQNLQQEVVSCFPVTRLSAEILAHIFELAAVPREESTPFSIPAQGPFYLAQVCKLWKAITESDPHLWTSLHFYFSAVPRSYDADVLRVARVFDLYLMRSGTLPLLLTFADHREYTPHATKLISLLVDRLRTHSRRWKHISLHMSCGYFAQLFTFTPCDLSSLEHLYIGGDEIWHNGPSCLNLKSATNLKSFDYSGPAPAPGHLSSDNIDLDWERLAELSFESTRHGGELPRLFRYLAQCRNITTCSLGIHHILWTEDPIGGQTITLPCLRTLRVRRLDPDPQSHACFVIDPLVLPQLQTLEIDSFISADSSDLSGPWHDRNFSNLLARSGCALQHLSIQGVYFPNDELLRCLVLSPTLTSFHFIPSPRSQDVEDVVRRLDMSRSQDGQEDLEDGPLVPGLREITLGTSNERYLDTIAAMLQSRGGAQARAAGVATLRRVEVVFFVPPRMVVGRGGEPPSERIARFRRELKQWISENEKEREGQQERRRGSMDEEKLEVSIVVHLLRVVEYDEVDPYAVVRLDV